MKLERLKELFEYDNGNLIWKKKSHIRSHVKIGSIAGCPEKKNGYIVIKVDKKVYKAHRLIWMYHNGTMPTKSIDHINHIVSDNRIENLRSVDSSENSKNLSLSKRSKSGVYGVILEDGRWRARITIDRKYLSLGSFKTKDEAIKARVEAEEKYGFHKNHGGVT